MTNPIAGFKDQYSFLSNFWPSRIFIAEHNIIFPTVEHAYQAAKVSLDHPEREKEMIAIAHLTSPGLAKRAGKTIQLRSDWERAKVPVMKRCLVLKFFSNDTLRHQLLATLPHELIEENTWGDTFWGVCRGQGKNMLGKLLMQVRQSAKQACGTQAA